LTSKKIKAKAKYRWAICLLLIICKYRIEFTFIQKVFSWRIILFGILNSGFGPAKA